MQLDPLYPHRFHPAYLRTLTEMFDPENLKGTAIEAKETIGNITYNKCISIDFCGIAATNLFGTELDRPEIDPEGFRERKKLAAAFRRLFEKDELGKLNKEGYYVRVRFCFSYLYSDFPICLMKAEQPDTWTNLADKPVDSFYRNMPLTYKEYEQSAVRKAQADSLIKIKQIVSKNKDVIITGGHYKFSMLNIAAYIPFLMLILIFPLFTMNITVFKEKTWHTFSKCLFTLNNLAYSILIIWFCYWGFYSIL